MLDLLSRAPLAHLDDGQAPDPFSELLDATVPWDGGTVVMLRAYCDASEQKGVFSVAAVAFGIDRAKKATREFAQAFGQDRICHMTDLHARRGQFEGIDDAEADRLCRAAVRIINSNASLISVVSCSTAEVEKLAPREATPDAAGLLDATASAYNCCMHWVMHSAGAMVGGAGGQRMQYWFELGDQYQGIARRFLESLGNPMMRPLRDSYAYGSDAFILADDARLFEAADVVAWEWARHVDRVRSKRPPRRSLVALMGDSDCTEDGEPAHVSVGRYGRHFSGVRLERFFGKMGRVMTATSHEEVWAAAKSRDWDAG